jgi:hypothetical protein
MRLVKRRARVINDGSDGSLLQAIGEMRLYGVPDILINQIGGVLQGPGKFDDLRRTRVA